MKEYLEARKMIVEQTDYNSWKLPLDYPAREALAIYAKRLLWLTVAVIPPMFFACIILVVWNRLLTCMLLVVVPSFMYFLYVLCVRPISSEYSPTNQARVAKALATLLASITTGAIVLIYLGYNPPSAGPFSLWTYHSLEPVNNAISSETAQSPGRWNRIEIFFSSTRDGNIEQLAMSNFLASPEDLNCHFVICNGSGGFDGQIQPTEKWQRQLSAIPDKAWYGSGQTVRICVIADGKAVLPTDNQIRRAGALAEGLSRRFDITSFHYPVNFQQE